MAMLEIHLQLLDSVLTSDCAFRLYTFTCVLD